MRNIFAFFFIFAVMSINGCTTNQLSYQIDPEITGTQQFKTRVDMIAIKVIDALPSTPQGVNPELLVASRPKDISVKLKQAILNQFKADRIKIINNPLLADLSITITLERLHALVDIGMIKSEIKVDSQVLASFKKQDRTFSKRLQNNRRQEVANPVNQNDISGLVNQTLGQQISQIFNDPELAKLLN